MFIQVLQEVDIRQEALGGLCPQGSHFLEPQDYGMQAFRLEMGSQAGTSGRGGPPRFHARVKTAIIKLGISSCEAEEALVGSNS